MIGLRVVLIVTCAISFLDIKNDIKPGIYGSYGSYSFYTELEIFEDNKFEYTDKPLNGVSVHVKGEWKLKEDRLCLISSSNSNRFKKEFVVLKDTLCPRFNKKKEPCLVYQSSKVKDR